MTGFTPLHRIHPEGAYCTYCGKHRRDIADLNSEQCPGEQVCRDELIRAGKPYPRQCPTCGLTGQCSAAPAAGEARKAGETAWVPVETRLPEGGGFVLVYCHDTTARSLGGGVAEVLEEIAISLNDWFRERREVHTARAKAHRERQERSWRAEPEPWVFAEEMIRRDDAELLEPIRVLMRKADAALAAANPAPAAGEARKAGETAQETLRDVLHIAAAEFEMIMQAAREAATGVKQDPSWIRPLVLSNTVRAERAKDAHDYAERGLRDINAAIARYVLSPAPSGGEVGE